MPEPDVLLENVTKRFAGVTAVDAISLEIAQGEFVALIGPSGCGKTTTLRMIAGLDDVTEGRICIKGQRMDGVPAYERDTATVWQQFALFPHLDVYRNVEFGLKMQGVPKAARRDRVRAILAKMGLSEFENRDIAQLSGGQRQRVGLARALVVDPAVLLLDEPLGSLDANLRVAMQSELKSLQRELGLTFIYVTHNQSEAIAMADRIAVMNRGRIEQLGSPQAVYQMPRTQFVAEFVGTNNIIPGRIVDSSGGTTRVETNAGVFAVSADETGPPAGTEVRLVVRADVIQIGSVDGDAHNRVRGVVRGEEYLGSGVTFTVESDGGQLLKVSRPHTRDWLRLELNDPVSLGWRKDDCFLLPWDIDGHPSASAVAEHDVVDTPKKELA